VNERYPATRDHGQGKRLPKRLARAFRAPNGALRIDVETEVHAPLPRVIAESEGSSEWISLVQRTTAAQLRELVTELSAAARLAVALKDPDGTPAVANLLGSPSRRALSRDRALARVCGDRCHAHCLRTLDSRIVAGGCRGGFSLLRSAAPCLPLWIVLQQPPPASPKWGTPWRQQPHTTSGVNVERRASPEVVTCSAAGSPASPQTGDSLILSRRTHYTRD
jgi:hypothetical protein